MKVLEKATTPNHTEIQLEDWFREDGGSYRIGAYPIAKNSSKYNLIKKNETFRLSLDFTNTSIARQIFEALKSGRILLEELPGYFHNGDKDAYYLGIVDVEPEL